MLEKIENLPPGVEGLRAIGKVTKADYENVFEPLVEAARREGRHLRFLYELGPEFEGFTPGGVWEDAKIGLRSIRLFDGCAVVTDSAWIRQSSRLASFFLPCPVHVYPERERDQAVAWLDSLPEGPGVSHRLIPECDVIVVEVFEPLRARDFETLSTTADAWIETHGGLHGIVVHARKFPGWENVTSFLSHVRFVRDHHRKVERVALAADSKLASLLPRLAEHFVDADVKSFAYDELDEAIAWAATRVAGRHQESEQETSSSI